MKFKATWFFWVIVAFALGFMVWDFRNSDQREEQERSAKYLISNLDMGKVRKVHYKSRVTEFEVEKAGEGWKFVKPLTEVVDKEAFETFVTGIAEQSMNFPEVSGNIQWSKFGFEPPEAALRIDFEDGSFQSFEVGTERTYNNNYYVRNPIEQKLMVGSRSWTSYLAKAVHDFRDKTVYAGPENIEDVHEIHIRHGDVRLTLKNEGDKWVAVEAGGSILDGSAVKSYFGQIKFLRADAVLPHYPDRKQQKAHGLLSPGLLLSVKSVQEGQKKLFDLRLSQDKNNEVFLMVSEDRPIYRIQARKLDSLKKSLKDFRDRETPFRLSDKGLDEAQVAEVKIGSTQKTLKDKSVLDSLKKDIQSLQVKEFIEDRGSKDSLKGQNFLVLKSEGGQAMFEMRWSEATRVKEEERVKLWTSLSQEAFWVEAPTLKKITDLVPPKDEPTDAPEQVEKEESP